MMNIRQYEEQLRRCRDPYSVWIEEQEEVLRSREVPFNKISIDIKKDARAEIAENYCFVALSDGVLDRDFFQRITAYLEHWRAENQNTIPDVIYFDEDQCDFLGTIPGFSEIPPEKKQVRNRRNPYFKPDYAPDTLRSFYYIGGLTLVRRGCGGESEADWENGNIRSGDLRDFVLRAKGVLHIPEVLYHTLSENDYSYSDEDGEGFPVETGDEKRENPSGERENDQKETADIIDVVILSKDHPEQLKTCISGLLDAGAREGAALSVVVVDNGSGEEFQQEYRKLAELNNFRYVFSPMPFHYARLCNIGADFGNNKYLLFLNDDVEIPDGTRFLRKMASVSSRLHVGAVGVKLLYPDSEHIQHAGISLLRTGPSHKLSGFTDRTSYYHGVNRRDGNFLAVTGACLMVERKKFEKVGGFDEAFRIGYTDTDLCLKLTEAGFLSVSLNSLFLLHHESMSRADDQTDRAGYERLSGERELFYRLHGETLKNGDPFYSRLLTDTGLDYRVNFPLPEETFHPVPKLLPMDNKVYQLRSSGKVMTSLDFHTFRIHDALGDGDYYELRGWAFVHGKRGYRFDPVLILRNTENKEEYLCPVCRVLREDLENVFPKEKGIALSGFVAKISENALWGAGRWEVYPALVKEGVFGKYQGVIGEKLCQIDRNGI